jgi:hypothetical protein
MGFSASIIEKWLLTGKALYRNASIGGAGLCRLKVPIGKTFIITKIEMLPIINIINQNENFADRQTFIESVANQNFSLISERLQFQLLFYNSRNVNHYNIRPKISLTADLQGANNHTHPGITAEKEIFNTFYVVEDDCWFYLKYLDFGAEEPFADTFKIYQDLYSNTLTGSQNWNPSNNFGYNLTDIDIATWRMNSPNADYSYTPTGQDNQYIIDQFILPNLSTNSHFLPPATATGIFLPIDSEFIYSIPFYNIEYVEINNRLSTTGLDI